MTARTVTGIVKFPDPSGSACVGARVVATLYSDGNVAYGTANDVVVGAAATLTNGSGMWALDLEPNSSITPSGSVWLVSITRPGGELVASGYVEVPDSVGPHNFTDILSERPGALPSRALDVHASDAATHGAAGAIVGTTNAQSLANKTLVDPTLSISSDSAASAARAALGAQRHAWNDPRDFGAVYGSVTSGQRALNVIAIQDALDAGNVVFSGGTCEISGVALNAASESGYGLKPAAGTTVLFTDDALLQLDSGVDVRHIFVVEGDGVTFINPRIDGGGSYCNGIGVFNSDGVLVLGGHFANIDGIWDPTVPITGLGGGRAVTFQNGARHCRLVGSHFLNCRVCVDITGTSSSPSWGNVASGYSAENCGVLCQALDPTSFGPLLGDPMYHSNGALFSDISFRNCGASPGYISASFIRKSSGNSWPWQDFERAGTSYSGDGYQWTLASFSAADSEWDEATSYSTNSRVKVTDDGSLGALLCFLAARHVTVSNVRGWNDDGYGTIGAVVWGNGQSISINNVDVHVDCGSLIRSGGCPMNAPNQTRNYHRQGNWRTRGVVNTGATQYVFRADGPVNVASEYYYFDSVFLGLGVMAAGNEALFHPWIVSNVATNGSTWCEIFNVEDVGVVSGPFPSLVAASATISSRWVMGVKGSSGSSYALTVDGSGRLLIGGTVVGTQT